jgi:hypothetical protein
MNFKLALVALVGCGATPSSASYDAPLTVPVPDARPAPLPDARSTALPDARQVTTADAPLPDGPSCGACPTDFHCGSANGVAVCRHDGTEIPRFSHVFVVVMENLSFSELQEADNIKQSPYLQGLMKTAAYGTNYHGVAHPSLPNYLALTSGDFYKVHCDCSPMGDGDCGIFSCTRFTNSCSCPQDAQHLGDQLEAASLSWRAYGESMGRDTPCRMDTDSLYAARHVPFVYYDNLQADLDRCDAHVVDYSYLAEETTVPSFVFIAPNLTDDMHDPIIGHSPNIMNGDTWLSQNVPALAATPGALVVVVWDEDDYSGLFSDDDPIPIFVLGPYAKKVYMSTVQADHYSLLATVEDGLGLGRIGNAMGATPLSDYFPDH